MAEAMATTTTSKAKAGLLYEEGFREKNRNAKFTLTPGLNRLRLCTSLCAPLGIGFVQLWSRGASALRTPLLYEPIDVESTLAEPARLEANGSGAPRGGGSHTDEEAQHNETVRLGIAVVPSSQAASE